MAMRVNRIISTLLVWTRKSDKSDKVIKVIRKNDM